MEYILSFRNTNLAIKTEQYLLSENLNVRVMPLPPQIQAGCGICLRLVPEEIKKAERIMQVKKIKGTRLYVREKPDNAYTYREIKERDCLWDKD